MKKHKAEAQEKLQTNLDRITKFSTKHGLKLNGNNTKIFFGSRNEIIHTFGTINDEVMETTNIAENWVMIFVLENMGK